MAASQYQPLDTYDSGIDSLFRFQLCSPCLVFVVLYYYVSTQPGPRTHEHLSIPINNFLSYSGFGLPPLSSAFQPIFFCLTASCIERISPANSTSGITNSIFPFSLASVRHTTINLAGTWIASNESASPSPCVSAPSFLLSSEHPESLPVLSHHVIMAVLMSLVLVETNLPNCGPSLCKRTGDV